MSVSIGILAEQSYHRRVCQRDGGSAEEFPYNHEQQQEEKSLLDVGCSVNYGRYDGLHPAIVVLLVVVGSFGDLDRGYSSDDFYASGRPGVAERFEGA